MRWTYLAGTPIQYLDDTYNFPRFVSFPSTTKFLHLRRLWRCGWHQTRHLSSALHPVEFDISTVAPSVHGLRQSTSSRQMALLWSLSKQEFPDEAINSRSRFATFRSVFEKKDEEKKICKCTTNYANTYRRPKSLGNSNFRISPDLIHKETGQVDEIYRLITRGQLRPLPNTCELKLFVVLVLDQFRPSSPKTKGPKTFAPWLMNRYG